MGTEEPPGDLKAANVREDVLKARLAEVEALLEDSTARLTEVEANLRSERALADELADDLAIARHEMGSPSMALAHYRERRERDG